MSEQNIHHRDTEAQRKTKSKSKPEDTEVTEATEGHSRNQIRRALPKTSDRSKPFIDGAFAKRSKTNLVFAASFCELVHRGAGCRNGAVCGRADAYQEGSRRVDRNP